MKTSQVILERSFFFQTITFTGTDNQNGTNQQTKRGENIK